MDAIDAVCSKSRYMVIGTVSLVQKGYQPGRSWMVGTPHSKLNQCSKLDQCSKLKPPEGYSGCNGYSKQ